MFLQNKLKGRGGTPKRKISAKEYLKDSHMTKIIFSKFCNSVKAIYCKILLLLLIIFCFEMIFQLFVILNKVSKSAEIASLEFQLLILQEMEHGNIFSSVKIFSKNFETSLEVQKEQFENATEQQSQSKPEYEAGLAK